MNKTAKEVPSAEAQRIKLKISYIRRSRVAKYANTRDTTEMDEDLTPPLTSAEDIEKKDLDLDSIGSLSVEESSADNVVHYEASTMEQETNFFDELGSIPSITDIRISSEEETREINLKSDISSSRTQQTADVGRFVDPLTGEVISSGSTLIETVEHVEPEEESIEDEEDDFALDDDDLLMEPEIIEDADIEEEPKDDMALWIELQPVKNVHIGDDTDFEKKRREEENRVALESTKQFLDELIDLIVEKCEYVNPEVVLRKQLNKKALMHELENLLEELDFEQKGHSFLNRKVVEHFRRKKSFRAITDDSPDTMLENMAKYKTARAHLDRLLARENDIKQVASEKTFMLIRQIDSMELDFRQKQRFLEDMIKKAMNRETFVTLRAEVESELRNMAEKRNEIAKVRCALIEQQHSLATLIQQSEKLDDLGEGLKLTTFETLSNETQSLEKKNEERTSDLLKLHRRFSVNLHTRAHLREKLAFLQQTVKVQEVVLEEIAQDHTICRKNVLDAKLRRAALVKEMREKSFEGGLSDKPWLMIDYDETVERVQKLRNKVQHLRQKHSDMENRIELMQNQQKSMMNRKGRI